MQSRQDYIIAVERRRDTRHEEDSPGDAATHAASRGVRWRGVLTRRVSTSYKVISTSYEVSSTSYEVSRSGLAGGVVTVTAIPHAESSNSAQRRSEAMFTEEESLAC